MGLRQYKRSSRMLNLLRRPNRSLTEIIRFSFDNIIKYNMKHFNKNPKSQTSFQIYYSPEFKMYDFTVFNYKKEIIYHYHFSNLKQINKLIQQYKTI